jgi:UV DNA damage endonuclease
VLETAARVDIPVVFDNLHNAINPTGMKCTEIEWIKECASTWKRNDGAQKIHYSQQHREKRQGAHSDTINADMFLQFFRQLEGAQPDIMLEVKDKNISALKCIHCVENRGISKLEAEWGRYKYSILERSPEIYNGIRHMLTDKRGYPAVEMYCRIDAAWGIPVSIGNAVNAAQHVWGYFKDKATAAEKNRFQQLLDRYASGGSGLPSIKKHLLSFARKYKEDYLLNGYYFYLS